MYRHSQKILSIFLTILLSLSIFVLPTFAAEATVISETDIASQKEVKAELDFDNLTLNAPSALAYSVTRNNVYDNFYVSYFVSEEIADIMAEKEENRKITIYMQTDWCVNDGEWNYDESWETDPMLGPCSEITSIVNKSSLFGTYSEYFCKRLNIKYGNKNSFDFTNNTLKMKSRYYVTVVTNPGTENETTKIFVSDWSKESKVTTSTKYDTSKINEELFFISDNLVFDKTLNNDPYFTFVIDWPLETKKAIANILAKENSLVSINCEKKIGNKEWEYCKDLVMDSIPYSYDEYVIEIPTTQIMSDTPIRYKISLSYAPGNGIEIDKFKSVASTILTYDYVELSKEAEENDPTIDPTDDEENNFTLIVIGCIAVAVILVGGIAFVVIKKKREEE